MSNKFEMPGFVRIKDKIPYHGKGIDELLGALRKILTDNKYTQKITMEVGTSHIAIEKLVPEAEAQEMETVKLSLHDIIRNRKLEEFDNDTTKPTNVLWEMFSMIHQEGLEVTNIVVGNKQKFQKWLGVHIPQKDLRVFGTPLEVIGDLPSDVFVVCGAKTRIAEPDDIVYCVKGTIDERTD